MRRSVDTNSIFKYLAKIIWPEGIDSALGFSDEELSFLLKKLGIGVHYMGYGYLKLAICLYAKRRERIMKIYSKVAKLYGVTGASVERTIRTAIEAGRRRCSIDFMESYFGNTIDANKGKATNEQFIATACEYLETSGREDMAVGQW